MTDKQPAPTTGTPAKAEKPKTMSELEVLIRARYPLLYVVSWEEQRVVEEVKRIAESLNKKIFEWSITTGLVTAGTSIQSQKNKDSATQDPLVALDSVIEHNEPALYVFKDFHPFLRGQNMSIIRRLREIAAFLKNTFKTIVIISPMFEMPAELEKDLTVVDYCLPGHKEFARLLRQVVEHVKDNPKLNVKLSPGVQEKIVHSLMGLTLSEAENVLAKTLVTHRELGEKSVQVINVEKKQIIRKSGILDFYETQEKLDGVGGLDELKQWLVKRGMAFSDQAAAFGLPAPKGVLLLGVQGCGKSLTAKAVSSIWSLPLLRFDVGKVFGSLVGSSEANVRRAIAVAESIAPTILWVDEIDKAFRGSRGSGGATDGGTSARVFGTFLTWLSEKTSPVFVVATANDVTMLPPELLRKGRFDEIFFVDLPCLQERRDIFKVHLSKRSIDPGTVDVELLAQGSSGFSGAEIEEAIISGLFEAFYSKEPLCTDTLRESLRQTVPLSKTMSEDIDRLRQWAQGRARPATSLKLAQEDAADHRRIEI